MIDGTLPEKVKCYLQLLFDPYILSGFVAAFIASVFWAIAMSKFELTVAYPFTSISPPIVFLLGVYFLGETFTLGKFLGLVFIIIGIIITVKL
jgi:undecaprenyl phosphate-alpha-L-ara4N flippase subunit ArnF